MTKLLVQLMLAALVGVTSPAWAEVSRDAAAAAAQRASGGGRVLSVEKVEAGRRAAWRVKVVTARGEVHVIMVDAGSGQAQ